MAPQLGHITWSIPPQRNSINLSKHSSSVIRQISHKVRSLIAAWWGFLSLKRSFSRLIAIPKYVLPWRTWRKDSQGLRPRFWKGKERPAPLKRGVDRTLRKRDTLGIKWPSKLLCTNSKPRCLRQQALGFVLSPVVNNGFYGMGSPFSRALQLRGYRAWCLSMSRLS